MVMGPEHGEKLAAALPPVAPVRVSARAAAAAASGAGVSGFGNPKEDPATLKASEKPAVGLAPVRVSARAAAALGGPGSPRRSAAASAASPRGSAVASARAPTWTPSPRASATAGAACTGAVGVGAICAENMAAVANAAVAATPRARSARLAQKKKKKRAVADDCEGDCGGPAHAAGVRSARSRSGIKAKAKPRARPERPAGLRPVGFLRKVVRA